MVWEKGFAKEYDGHMAAIDGFTGTIYIDPDEETMKAMTEKREEDRRQKTLLEELKGKENVTLPDRRLMSMRISVIFPMWAP